MTEIIRHLAEIKPRHKNSVVTVGNFDGVHRGHQQIISLAKQQADALEASMGIVTFEPHPIEFLNPQVAPTRLTAWREKYQLLRYLGCDFILVLPFNNKLAQKTATEFVKDVLVEGLAVQSVIVGDDFRFGKNREGSFTLLDKLAKMSDFLAIQVPAISDNGQRISSTKIRELLKNGDLSAANNLLAHPFSLSGRIVAGAKRGVQLGFPTANIPISSYRLPFYGVYAVAVQSKAFVGTKYGVANLGNRPTVDGTHYWLEVHLFDFNGNLYGHRVEVAFIAKLRDEKKFNSLDELKQQIAKDSLRAKEILEVKTSHD